MKLFSIVHLMALSTIVLTGCESMHTNDTGKNMKKSKSGSQASTMSTTGSVTCTFHKETRTLESKSAANGGCEVVYTKGGNPSTVATAKNADYCGQVVEKMKGKLVAGGWSCN